jgi:hypothetical protein
MERLITSSWSNYRIAHMEGDEDLKDAVDKILPLCGYQKVYDIDDPLILGGDIPIRITADWIIKLDPEISTQDESIIMITLCYGEDDRTPDSILTFLKDFGVEALDYPPVTDISASPMNETPIVYQEDDLLSLIERLLNMVGPAFTREAEVTLYQKERADFSLIVNADFMLNIDGRDHIIDLSGLGPDIINLLQEDQFSVLSLSGEESASTIVTRTLEFLGVPFDSNPHPFLASNRAESRNIRIMIPGIVFHDNEGIAILATHLRLSPAISEFLSQKGYNILLLPLS